MTPHGLMFLLGLGLMPLGYVAALIAHRRGRSTRIPMALVTVGFGLGFGAGLMVPVATLAFEQRAGLELIISLGIPLVLAAAIVVQASRRGARWLAGAFLAAAASGWIVAWSSLFADVFTRVPRGQIIGAAAIPGGLVALVIGIALLVVRNPRADPRSPEAQARRRRIGAFGAAFMDQARLGFLTPAYLAAILAPIVISLDPSNRLDGIPAVILAVLVAVIVTELELRFVPPAIRPALEAFHWIGRGELERFKTITGRTIPVTKGGAARWLATPAREPELEYRSELLVWLDRRADALAVVARMPERTPMQRLQKALEADLISWSADGHERGIDFAGLAAAVEDEAERLRADGLVAYRASQHRFAAGDPDWLAPLTAHRAKLGHAADGLHARAMRKATLLPAVLVALFLSVLIQSGPMAA